MKSGKKLKPHIICGYEHLDWDMICVLRNNHDGDHAYVSMEEYHAKNLDKLYEGGK